MKLEGRGSLTDSDWFTLQTYATPPHAIGSFPVLGAAPEEPEEVESADARLEKEEDEVEADTKMGWTLYTSSHALGGSSAPITCTA
mmetsp:Transcript_4080/g.8387  ORF Transcript_4080/g.8387 Transcript_4080/m.8387 type:complete len:86 (-) Transcript_4080:1305-1562(-)